MPVILNGGQGRDGSSSSCYTPGPTNDSQNEQPLSGIRTGQIPLLWFAPLATWRLNDKHLPPVPIEGRYCNIRFDRLPAFVRFTTARGKLELHRRSAGSTARQVLDLSGSWRFKRDDNKQGINQNWFANILPANGSGPTEILLPGTTDQAGAGIPNPEGASLSGLYRPNIYTGPAWYQREIEIPLEWKGKSVTLFMERTHWVTHAWLDGKALGTQESLIAPHLYDLGASLSAGKHLLTICVDNTLLFDLGDFVSIYYEGTQTNWNGIIGRIELTAKDPVSLTKIQVYPDVDRKSAKVKLRVGNRSGANVSGISRYR